MQPLPLDTESFVAIRTANPQKLYVDKTAYLHRLITDSQSRNFFLSRPRRFGKSLMISTLEAIFQGKRDLFKGLAIDRTNYDWKAHPVIHLNMGFCASPDFDEFAKSLPVQIENALKAAGYAYDKACQAADNFGDAIDWFDAQGTPCVILIDEYDDPVAKMLHDPEAAERVRDRLSLIYRQMKDRTAKIRFLMITGVSRFTKLSIFSTISNLVDLSFRDEYSTMLGYTEAELDANFAEHIAAHAAAMGLSVADYRVRLRELFNGYRFWRQRGENVYNPVSVNLNLGLCESQFSLYWTQTGRPAMLMNYLKRGDLLSLDPENVTGVGESDFDVSDLRRLKAVPLLYQTGYLTIRAYNPALRVYTLGVPDEEVRQDLSLLMASQMAREDVAWAASIGVRLLLNEWDRFFTGLAALYAGLTYGSTEERVHESSYTRCLQFLLQGQGMRCASEVAHASGRTDLVADHPCGTYIFELKVDAPAVIAMTQAERQSYAAPYAAADKPVWVIGLAFDSKTRHLIDHSVENFTKGTPQ